MARLRNRVIAAVVTFVAAAELPAVNGEHVVRESYGHQSYWVEQIAEGLNLPSSMAWLPSGDMLITERMGSLRVVRRGKLESAPVNGVPKSYVGFYDGLKDIAVDPDYQTNQNLYFFVSEGTFEQHYAAIYRARFQADRLTDATRIFRSKNSVGGPNSSITGRMIFLADKTLLFSLTEGRAQQSAQQLDSQMGKLLRIHRDGSIPKDNPFFDVATALPEVWSLGHRVPLGLYQDPQTKVIWEVESGPRGGDELNVLKPGANYGWAKASWGFAYGNHGLEAPLQSGAGIEDPVLIWMPSVTPSGLTRVRGTVYPLWDGDYFVGFLSGKALARLRIDGNYVVLQERMLWDLDERIRDVRVGPDNHIYLLTDNQNGRALRLQPGKPNSHQLGRVAHKLEKAFSPSDVVDMPAGGDEKIANMDSRELEKGKEEFLARCAACHRVGSAVLGGEIGPDLVGVYGSFMGRKPGFDYSTSMAGGLIPWGFATLNKFLTNPQGLVPGTNMAAAAVADEQVRRQIIGFLKQQSESHTSVERADH